MNAKDISAAKNPDLRASLEAMRRAAREARRTAIETNTGIVVGHNGQLVHISAKQLRQTGEQG